MREFVRARPALTKGAAQSIAPEPPIQLFGVLTIVPTVNSSPRRVLLIDAGGTIAQSWDPDLETLVYADGATPFGWLEDGERSRLSQIARIDFALAHMPHGDSIQLRATDWGKLAEQVFSARNSYDGFVVSHGTATLSYGASLLSFMLAGLRAPVIFTGAQIPVRGAPPGLDSDGLANLRASIQVAAEGIVRRVAIVFGGSVLQGNRSHKANAFARDAFVSPNSPLLGRLGPSGARYSPQPKLPRPPRLSAKRRFQVRDSVQVLHLHPALPLDPITVHQKRSALLVGGYLAGSVPPNVAGHISSIAQSALVVVFATADLGPPSGVLPWSSSPKVPRDAVWAGDMTFEATLMKTCWVLAQTNDLEDQRKLLSTNVAGEMSVGLAQLST